MGGVERRAIVIAPADPAWPEAFARERERILSALGDRAIRVDHIGSTSVPGLPAKPIIDIDVSVADVEDEITYLPDWQRRHLLFRDWLRHDDTDRQAYAELKRTLAAQIWPDMNAYADAKGPLIATITERAEEWARVTGWTV